MRKLSITFLLLSIFSFYLIFSKDAHASEGTIELESLTGDSYRCYAASIQMIDLKYNILITCRDLLYPAGDNIFNYMLWATQVGNGKPTKLGQLGLGRASFKTSAAFSDLYVTTEKNTKVKEPTGTTVMSGDVQPIAFLEAPTKMEEEEEVPSEASPTATPSSTSARDRLIAGLKRAALVSLLALLALVGLVFVLTRKR